MAGRLRPKERRRRRKKSAILAKLAVIVALSCAALVVFAIGNKIVRPFRLWFVEKQSVNQLQTKLAELKHENIELQAKREYLKSAAGAENEARRLGYVSPGEVAVVIETSKPKAPAQKPRN